MRLTLAVLLLLVRPALAAAPEVDVAGLCRDMAWTGATISSTVLDECRRWEDDARRQVAPVWETLPYRLRWHCGRLAFANGTGSYKALAMCIRTIGAAQ